MSRSDERVLEYSHPWVEQVVLVKSLGGAAVCLPGHVRCSEHTKPSTLLTGLAYCCRHPHDYERGASEGDAAGFWATQGLHPHPAAGEWRLVGVLSPGSSATILSLSTWVGACLLSGR